MCIRQSTDETSNTKNTVTHHWATKWPNSTFLKLKVTQTRHGGTYGVQIVNSHRAHLIEEKASWGLFRPLEPKHHVCNRTGKIIQFWCFISKKWRLIKINHIGAFCYLPDQMKNSCKLQFRTKLLEKVFPIMSTFLCNNTERRITERKPLPPIQCCFLQTARDQAFFWIRNNIALRGRGRGKNWYSYDV